MRRKGIFALFLLLAFTALSAQSLEQQLFDLEDISFVAMETQEGFSATYELRVRQPLDHQDPSLGYFYQRVFLSHRSPDRPMVMATEGYARSAPRLYEPTELLNANQLDVEHRYFGESMPDSLDYRFLNLEQATADLHHIRELLGKIYTGKWISTGISKGGQTTLFYRYFYPSDVTVSIPYVAPLNLEFEEKRIYSWLDTIGEELCRKKIYEVQVRLLKERKAVLDKLHWYAKGKGLDFTYLTKEEAFEYAVLEYPFSFWQWGASCADLPDKQTPLDQVLDHFLGVSNIDFFADQSMEAFASHYYQAATQMGYYGYETEDFKGLLKALPMEPHPHAAFIPDKMPFKYDGTVCRKASDWLAERGDRIIYIYGANDTWSATAVPPSDKVDALWFFLKGRDHGQARIRNMQKSEKERMVSKLSQWLQMEISSEN